MADRTWLGPGVAFTPVWRSDADFDACMSPGPDYGSDNDLKVIFRYPNGRKTIHVVLHELMHCALMTQLGHTSGTKCCLQEERLSSGFYVFTMRAAHSLQYIIYCYTFLRPLRGTEGAGRGGRTG
eukprot:200631-Chlamydomonas_euryale.AAC.1